MKVFFDSLIVDSVVVDDVDAGVCLEQDHQFVEIAAAKNSEVEIVLV